MSIDMASRVAESLGELRYESTPKRIRALADGVTIVDTTRALLVWEPRRVVPGYAVPEQDLADAIRVSAEVEPLGDNERDARFRRSPVWDPRTPFDVRDTSGQPVTLALPSARRINAFRANDPALDGYVIVDFAGPDQWLEDDDEIVSHPHDPHSRIDIRSTSQRIQVSIDGVMVADSIAAKILYETGIAPRYYLPREDVLVDLAPSDLVTRCAYKGAAIYHSPVIDGDPRADLAWSYQQPLIDAELVRGYISFYNERVDIAIDGEPVARPVTPWS